MAKLPTVSARWTWATAGLCGLSAALLGWQLWRADAPLSVAPRASPGAAPAATSAAFPTGAGGGFELAAAEDYSEFSERPLFVRSRRALSAEERARAAGGNGGEAEDAPVARLSVAGVLLTPARRVALLRLDEDPKIMHVAEGQEAGGWLIESIRADRVLLRRGDESSEVVLDFKRHGAPAAAQGAAPGRPARPGAGQARSPGRPPRPAAPVPARPLAEDEEPAE